MFPAVAIGCVSKRVDIGRGKGAVGVQSGVPQRLGARRTELARAPDVSVSRRKRRNAASLFDHYEAFGASFVRIEYCRG
jgi:hypothetical protein